MRVLLLSPYHGGSHAAWAEGLQRHSGHDIELLALPDRFWKWRMHGGAVTLARRFMESCERPDVILATDMLDLSTFLALTRSLTSNVPALLYMHENQLTYPLPAEPDRGPMRRQKGERDHHYAFVNYASMLAAERVVFNSDYHRRAWFEELPRFLRHFPEYNELDSVAELRGKSEVLPVGIECGDYDEAAAGKHPASAPTDAAGGAPSVAPLLIWNQRWEYDKNPAQLLRALRQVADRGVPFRLAICGQAFNEAPEEFAAIEASFADHLVHFGFAERAEYLRLLDEADITVSTAEHEFFGIAVLEAMARGAFAVLPDRLSYPELLSGAEISPATRRRCLYDAHDDLVEKLVWGLQNVDEARRLGGELARNARRFDWATVAPDYDALLERVCQGVGCGKPDTTLQ